MNIAQTNHSHQISTLHTVHFASSEPKSVPNPDTNTHSDQLSISQEGKQELEALADKVAEKLSAMTKEDFMNQIDQWRKEHQPDLAVNPYWAVDPDGSLGNQLYFESYLTQLEENRSTIEAYYADAYQEALSCPSGDSLSFISGKYLCSWSGFFDDQMPSEQRQWTYAQVHAMLTGTGVALNDPYALASVGSPKTVEQMDKIARQYVKEKLIGPESV